MSYMLTTMAWAASLSAFIVLIMLLTMTGWGAKPTWSRIAGCLALGIVASVVAMMVAGSLGAPEAALTASTPIAIAMGAVVIIRARQTQPQLNGAYR